MNKDLQGSALIFDLDGTLVDTAADLGVSLNHALEAAQLAPVPLAGVRHLVGHGAKAMIHQGYEISAERSPSENEVDCALQLFLEHYGSNIAVRSRPFDGVLDLLDRAQRRGVAIAICTNKREALAKQLIEELQLTHHFAIIVGADTASAAKPDPAPVKLCLEATQASRAIFIGDSDTDIRAAKAADLPCFLASFGYGPTTLSGEASFIFDAYADIEEKLFAALSV